MTASELHTLIGQPEGLKLDFKREYKLTSEPPPGTDAQVWKTFIRGQWDEFVRDVLALTNGNVGTAGEVGRLVIGVGDELRGDGERDIFDTRQLKLTGAQLLERINHACTPPLHDIHVERVELNGLVVTVIVLPATPFIHETTRQLTTTKGEFDGDGRLRHCKNEKTYSEGTVFLRRGEGIFPAQYTERQALARERERLPISGSPVAAPRPEVYYERQTEEYRTVGLPELLQRGWTIQTLIDELLGIDYDTLAGLDERSAGTTIQWEPVVENNPDGMAFVVNRTGTIVGYWHFVALERACFRLAKQGKLIDGEISLDTMSSWQYPATTTSIW